MNTWDWVPEDSAIFGHVNVTTERCCPLTAACQVIRFRHSHYAIKLLEGKTITSLAFVIRLKETRELVMLRSARHYQ